MKVYLIKKEKYKKYESPDVVKRALGRDLKYSEDGAPLGCSISNTKNYWIYAEGDCGIDIEEKGRAVKESVVKKLHPLEREYMKALAYGTSEWTDEFLHIWTVKEAWLKLLKTGLSGGLDSFSVLNDDLSYKDGINGYSIYPLSHRNLVGTLITKDEYEGIETVKFAGKTAKPCMDYAADLLAIKAYSKSDLTGKLRLKGYSEDEIRNCIERFEELGYLNDAEYARRFAESAALSNKGSGYVRQKLSGSGIAREDMPVFDREEEYERALALGRSLFKEIESREEKEKLLAKIGRKLASSGFDPSTIYKVLAKLR